MVSPCREEKRRFEHEEAACGSRQGRETPGRQHRKALYTELQITGKLNGYLADLNKQAVSVFLELVKQMAAREGVTEQLKVQDQMLWGAGLRWRPLPKAEAPTEAAAETSE